MLRPLETRARSSLRWKTLISRRLPGSVARLRACQRGDRLRRHLHSIARADFLERVRRYSFLLTLLFAVFLGYAAATGRIAVQLKYRASLYLPAWIGALIAITTTCFISLIGFLYREERHRTAIAKPASARFWRLLRFQKSRVHAGQIPQQLCGSCFDGSGFSPLPPSLCADIRRRGSAFRWRRATCPLLFSSPLPSMALTAALAVLFETLPVLRGGIGNVAWFFVWSILGIGLPEISGNHHVDPMGFNGCRGQHDCRCAREHPR